MFGQKLKPSYEIADLTNGTRTRRPTWYEDQRTGLGIRFLNELSESFGVSKTIRNSFRSWKEKSVEPSSVIFPMGSISSKGLKMLSSWRCSISIGNRICGRAGIKGKDPRYCAVTLVRPCARREGQIQLGNAYHARGADRAESAVSLQREG